MTEFSSPETAQRVLAHLVALPHFDGEVVAAYRDIAAVLCVGRNTVYRAIARLVAEEQISVVRIGTGDGYPTRYSTSPAVTPPLAAAG